MIHVHVASIVAIPAQGHLVHLAHRRDEFVHVVKDHGVVRLRCHGVKLHLERDRRPPEALLVRLDRVPSGEGPGEVVHPSPFAGVAEPYGEAHEISPVLLGAVAEDGDLGLGGRNGPTGLHYGIPYVVGDGVGEVQQDEDLMGGHRFAEDHGVQFFTPMGAVARLPFDALGRAAHLLQHGRPFSGRVPCVGECLSHIGVEGIRITLGRCRLGKG